MGRAVVIRPTLTSVETTFRDPDKQRRPRLRYACVMEYRAWVHVIQLGVRMMDPILLRDARNVLCRALMDMGVAICAAETEARTAVRQPKASMIINGRRYVGKSVEAKRFRAVAVDVRAGVDVMRVVAVVPAMQQEIHIELSDV